jgi:hypothetical protein
MTLEGWDFLPLSNFIFTFPSVEVSCEPFLISNQIREWGWWPRDCMNFVWIQWKINFCSLIVSLAFLVALSPDWVILILVCCLSMHWLRSIGTQAILFCAIFCSPQWFSSWMLLSFYAMVWLFRSGALGTARFFSFWFVPTVKVHH